MGKLLLGLLFGLIDFNITVGNCVLGLLPDFIGYNVIRKGAEELEDKSEYFKMIQPIAKVMFIVTAVRYALDALGLYAILGFVGTLIDFAIMIVMFVVTYRIVQGVEEIEKNYKISLVGDIMRQAWWIRTACTVFAYVALFIPMLLSVAVIASIVSGVWFLIVFLQSKRLYVEKFGEEA
ncbi:MAG: hypothetical protein IJ326_00750 [Lachnospiraceae bacterium]|nr:hypothetical protein [Lachnospiraceae bacterium]